MSSLADFWSVAGPCARLSASRPMRTSSRRQLRGEQAYSRNMQKPTACTGSKSEEKNPCLQNSPGVNAVNLPNRRCSRKKKAMCSSCTILVRLLQPGANTA